jgi:hypothetical protein
MLTRRGKLVTNTLAGSLVAASIAAPMTIWWFDISVADSPSRPTQVTVEDCTYRADGSGKCGSELIPPLTEYDADFCNDIDPAGTVILLCQRPTHPKG